MRLRIARLPGRDRRRAGGGGWSSMCWPGSRPPSTAPATRQAYLPGFGIVPAESVRDLAKSARLKPLTVPKGAPEPGYRPSAALAEFVRWRDLTCRFPGCDAPAAVCDIDHTVPYPRGATHPSNAKLYCRAQDWVNTLNYHCKSYHDLPAGQSVQLRHRGLSYSPKAGLIRRSQRFNTHKQRGILIARGRDVGLAVQHRGGRPASL